MGETSCRGSGEGTGKLVGGAAGTAKVLLDIAKLQTAAAASADFEAFKTAIAALTP